VGYREPVRLCRSISFPGFRGSQKGSGQVLLEAWEGIERKGASEESGVVGVFVVAVVLRYNWVGIVVAMGIWWLACRVVAAV